MSARAQALAAPAAPPGDGNPASWFWSLIDAGFLAKIVNQPGRTP